MAIAIINTNCREAIGHLVNKKTSCQLMKTASLFSDRIGMMIHGTIGIMK